jgi:hypothetical protein
VPSTRIDPHAEAGRLLAQISSDDLAELADDPVGAIEVLFDIEITSRPAFSPGTGCDIDGLYLPGPPPHIMLADDVSQARQRFTALHELGHHLIEYDNHLNDLDIDTAHRRDEEICNEVAASILIPAATIAKLVPPSTFTAHDVAELHAAVGASRAACCVAAVRQLHRPGCVILGEPDGTAVFIAHHSATRWRIARNTPQGTDSLLATAGHRPGGHARGVTRARFANGNISGELQGDAFADHDGWVFAVFVEDPYSPWQSGLSVASADTGPTSDEIECPHCLSAGESWSAPCPTCRERRCSNCGRCSCPVGPATRQCGCCFLMKPANQFVPESPYCADCR